MDTMDTCTNLVALVIRWNKSRQTSRLHELWHKLRCCRKLLQFASKILFLWFIAFAFSCGAEFCFSYKHKIWQASILKYKCKRLVLKVLFWAALLWYTGPWGNIKPHIFLTFNMKQSQIWKVSTVSSRAACTWYLFGICLEFARHLPAFWWHLLGGCSAVAWRLFQGRYNNIRYVI